MIAGAANENTILMSFLNLLCGPTLDSACSSLSAVYHPIILWLITYSKPPKLASLSSLLAAHFLGCLYLKT